MKFTFAWLCDHLETNHSLGEICEALPMLGLEVEEVNDPAASLAPFSVRSRLLHPTSAAQAGCHTLRGAPDIPKLRPER